MLKSTRELTHVRPLPPGVARIDSRELDTLRELLRGDAAPSIGVDVLHHRVQLVAIQHQAKTAHRLPELIFLQTGSLAIATLEPRHRIDPLLPRFSKDGVHHAACDGLVPLQLGRERVCWGKRGAAG